MKNKKELGQHWLRDRAILTSIAECAMDGVSDKDATVLEIGPGQGTLTSVLLKHFGRVVAVEYDEDLARKLPGQFPGKDLEAVNEDFLLFDLGRLPEGYMVVANVPYYITGKIVQKLMEAENRPRRVVLLVQREVAERLAASEGDLSILGISVQVYAEVSLGEVVRKEAFVPPPKVDSQVVVFEMREQPLVTKENEKDFFRLVKMGFIAPRKKLAGNLAAGLHVSKEEIVTILESLGIEEGARAEALAIGDWERLRAALKK